MKTFWAIIYQQDGQTFVSDYLYHTQEAANDDVENYVSGCTAANGLTLGGGNVTCIEFKSPKQ